MYIQLVSHDSFQWIFISFFRSLIEFLYMYQHQTTCKLQQFCILWLLNFQLKMLTPFLFCDCYFAVHRQDQYFAVSQYWEPLFHLSALLICRKLRKMLPGPWRRLALVAILPASLRPSSMSLLQNMSTGFKQKEKQLGKWRRSPVKWMRKKISVFSVLSSLWWCFWINVRIFLPQKW